MFGLMQGVQAVPLGSGTAKGPSGTFCQIWQNVPDQDRTAKYTKKIEHSPQIPTLVISMLIMHGFLQDFNSI